MSSWVQDQLWHFTYIKESQSESESAINNFQSKSCTVHSSRKNDDSISWQHTSSFIFIICNSAARIFNKKYTFTVFQGRKKNPTGLEWCEDEQVIISRQTCFKIELAQTYHSSIRYCWCLECLNDKCQHFDGDPGSWVNKSAQNPTGDHHHSTQLELSKTHTWIKQRNGWDEKRQGWRVAKCHVFMPCTEQLILCLFPHKHMHFSRLNRVTRN